MLFTHIGVQPIPGITSKDTPRGRFYTTPDKNIYPSITTILGQLEKPAVLEWRSSLGNKKADAETKRAADRGTAVHEMIEKYINNDANPTHGYDSLHIRDFLSVKLHLNKINNVLCQEIPLYSDFLKVAGRVDCIGEFKGKLCIIDFKTSTGNKTKEMIHDYFLQTTAYAVMFQELYDIQIDDIIIIMSVEKGAVPLLFKEKVDHWIEPLCKRINMFHTTNKKV